MKISVTLPNFNHGNLVGENIESVIRQTYGNWELVIVDDGSTDESWSVIDSYRAKDPRIVAKRFESNRGAVAAIGQCMHLCTGELLYGSAADDYIDNPRFFELVVSAVAANRTAAGVFGQSRVIDGVDGRELWVMGASSGGGYLTPARAIEEFGKGGLFVPGASAVWRREFVDRLGGFDPELGPQCDYFINHALPMLHGAVFIDQVVSVTRLFESSYSAARNDDEFFRYHALTERKFMSLPLEAPLSDDWRRAWRSNVMNGRLAITRQRQFSELIKRFYDGIQAWEESSLPQRFQECRREVLAHCAKLEEELAARIDRAESVFDDVGGHVPAARASGAGEAPAGSGQDV